MNLIILFLLIHWLADFCLQTDYQAKKKSTNTMQLTYHAATYSIVWLLVAKVLLIYWVYAIVFAVVTFVSHWITDYCTSRLVKSYFDRIDHHNAFVIIGFDQILHYLQLFLTYEWLSSSLLRKFAETPTLFYG